MGKVYCVFRDDPPPVDGERGVRWPKLVDFQVLASAEEVLLLPFLPVASTHNLAPLSLCGWKNSDQSKILE